jgi:hypothetical protein
MIFKLKILNIEVDRTDISVLGCAVGIFSYPINKENKIKKALQEENQPSFTNYLRELHTWLVSMANLELIVCFSSLNSLESRLCRLEADCAVKKQAGTTVEACSFQVIYIKNCSYCTASLKTSLLRLAAVQLHSRLQLH